MHMELRKLYLEITRPLSYVGLELSLVSVRRTVLVLTRSGIRFRHCFF